MVSAERDAMLMPPSGSSSSSEEQEEVMEIDRVEWAKASNKDVEKKPIPRNPKPQNVAINVESAEKSQKLRVQELNTNMVDSLMFGVIKGWYLRISEGGGKGGPGVQTRLEPYLGISL